MSQPKLSAGTRALLDHHEMQASLYQPVSMFHKNGRKLPHCAEPGDPWQCFLRRQGEFGVISEGYGATPDDAVAAALYHRPGLKYAMVRLEHALDDLIGAIHARQS